MLHVPNPVRLDSCCASNLGPEGPHSGPDRALAGMVVERTGDAPSRGTPAARSVNRLGHRAALSRLVGGLFSELFQVGQ
jgi:hypothetical protein